MAGNLYWINESLADRYRPGAPPIRQDHPVITVTPAEIASAIGLVHVCQLTSGTARRAPAGCYPFEHEVNWAGSKSGESSIVKAYGLFPVAATALQAYRGPATSLWERPLRRHISAMSWNEAEATELHRDRPYRATNIHPVVSEARRGDVLRINGQDAVVLSNAAFNRGHAYGTLLVAPLRDATRGNPIATALAFDGRRVAVEETQCCQLLAGGDEVDAAGEVSAPPTIVDLGALTYEPRVSALALLFTLEHELDVLVRIGDGERARTRICEIADASSAMFNRMFDKMQADRHCGAVNARCHREARDFWRIWDGLVVMAYMAQANARTRSVKLASW